MGDSISAAYGMSLNEGWARLLQDRLNQQEQDWLVVNASISGETSAGALARLPSLLAEHQPEVVIIELGGNDGLRGYPIRHLRKNLREIIEQTQQMGASVMLLGMEIPPNYGTRYTQMFRDTYTLLAQNSAVELVPFFLDGIATKPELMQANGIHPKPDAQVLLLENVWPQLKFMLNGEN